MPGTNANGHSPRPPQPAAVSLGELQARFEQARDANQAKLAELEHKGVAADPLSFLHARIDSLIDSISRFAGPNGPLWATTARLEFENGIAVQLAEIEQQATKAQLAQGALWTPSMISDLARQTGLFKRS
jgi:hypothetical protein